jgi:hypothetical protein
MCIVHQRKPRGIETRQIQCLIAHKVKLVIKMHCFVKLDPSNTHTDIVSTENFNDFLLMSFVSEDNFIMWMCI